MKTNYLLFVTILSVLSFVSCEGAEVKRNDASGDQTKLDIIKIDEIDPTNVLAIPFDESEVEDEQQINLDEHQKVFNLPQTN